MNGPNVDFATQNGWVLYFSDRRGMLNNPNAPFNGAAKSGDSGLEDSINRASSAGVPDGNLDPIPAGKQFSPEDVNQNKLRDFFGSQNIGLGFYNGATNINRGAGGITSAVPNNVYLPRLTNATNTGCLVTGRKNWVSGARHVLKLVDGSLGNVPYRLDGTLVSPGGFTVASENPVYVQGNYNSSAADTTWAAGGADQLGHAAAAVIADSVTLLSTGWSDLNSLKNPYQVGNRNAATTYYRLAIAGGKNMNFPQPAAGHRRPRRITARTAVRTTSSATWKIGAGKPSGTRGRWSACTTPPTTPACTSAVRPCTRRQRVTTASMLTLHCRAVCRPELRCSATWIRLAIGSSLRFATSKLSPTQPTRRPGPQGSGRFVWAPSAAEAGFENRLLSQR